MLDAERLSFAYRERPVLREVSLSVGAGELVAVVGRSGAGKSTLLRLCAGLLAPASGRVRIGGDEPAALDRRLLARRVAYLAQEVSLAFPFTVAEVVLMGRYPHRSPLQLESEADVAAARAAMRACDVDALADRRFPELSGGERRRALLAQAFCQAAPLVLLDEPTASLDPAHAIAVLGSLRARPGGGGAAALWVTHDLDLAARFADRVVVLDDGRVVAAGPPAEVFAGAEAARAFGVPLHVGTLPGGGVFVVPGSLR